MRVNKITIKNFKKFKELDLTFKDGVNILIGNNASGKTSILEALKILLGGYFYGINSHLTSSPSIHKTRDVQNIIDEQGKLKFNYPTCLYAEGIVHGERVKWNRDLNRAKGSTTIAGLSHIKTIVSKHSDDTQPIIAYYGIDRLKQQKKEHGSYKKQERFIAYRDALNASASIGDFAKWFENEDRISYKQGMNTNALQIVSEAIKNSLPNCNMVFYDPALSDIIIIDENNKRTAFSLMSDGYKLITSLIGDLAYRCAVLNDHLGIECLNKTTGVVLIDEVEIHLHPSWQQRVVNDLKRSFPKIQFIISTHSPIVLSGVEANVIRLGESGVYGEELLTYGRRPEYIMYSEQGVISRNEKIQGEIDKFYVLIESKEGLKEAKVILESLFIKQFGERDPDTVRAKGDYEFALMEFNVEE
ncbi:MAG: AAA family ATPase [Marinifilaceae bacterium]